MRVVVETVPVAGVPHLLVYPAEARALPLVLFMHGMTAEKTQGIEFGYRLARRGFFFAAPDAPGHGERSNGRWQSTVHGRQDNDYPAATGLDLWRLMLQVTVEAAEESAKSIAAWQGDQRVNAERLGVAGISMGGYWAHYMAAHYPAVRVAVPVIGMPAWGARWADVTLEAASYEQWATAVAAASGATARWAAWIANLDPLPRMSHFAPRPLLMINGEVDVDQPKSYTVGLYRDLLPHYARHPERLRLSIHDGVAHRFESGMMEEAAEWFERWL